MRPRIRLIGLALAGGLVSVPVPAHAASCPLTGSGFFDPTFLCRLFAPTTPPGTGRWSPPGPGTTYWPSTSHPDHPGPITWRENGPLEQPDPDPFEWPDLRPTDPPNAIPTWLPGTDRTRLPGTDPSRMPGTDGTRMPDTDPTRLPGTDPTRLPGTDGARLPGTAPSADPARHNTGNSPDPAEKYSSPTTPGSRDPRDPAPPPDAKPAITGDARKRPKPRPSRKRPRTKGEIAVAAALARIGTPFSWGGGSLSGPTRGIGKGARTVGFDCSGLTMYAWARAGVRLGHYTGTQFRQGRRVPLSELRTGDLLFFGGGSGDPTHVGLYHKNGFMVHAPKTGDVVRVAQFLRSPYFRSNYRGAVRPG